MTKTEYKLIQERLINMGQSWNFTRVLRYGPNKYQVKIKRNAYDHQSFASVSLWDGERWSHVIGDSIDNCECRVTRYTQKDPQIDLFRMDATRLTAMAREVVENADSTLP